MDDTVLESTLSDDDDLLGDETARKEDEDLSKDDAESFDDEKTSIREEESDIPVGLDHSDPGIESDDWEAREMHRGVGDNEDEEDVEALGFSVEDGSGNDVKIDTFGDE